MRTGAWRNFVSVSVYVFVRTLFRDTKRVNLIEAHLQRILIRAGDTV